MNTAIRSLIAGVTLAASLGAAPAFAGGSVSVNLNPTDPEKAQALQTGLRFYGLVKGIKDGSITQNGFGNAAGLMQNGSGNLGVIHQNGDGHVGTIEQNGNGNACGLFQFGQNTEAHLQQNGDDGACATVQFGW